MICTASFQTTGTVLKKRWQLLKAAPLTRLTMAAISCQPGKILYHLPFAIYFQCATHGDEEAEKAMCRQVLNGTPWNHIYCGHLCVYFITVHRCLLYLIRDLS